MNRSHCLIVALLVFLAIFLGSCGSNSQSPFENPVIEEVEVELDVRAVEIIDNVFDDGHSSAFIKVRDPQNMQEDAAIGELMVQKQAWMEEFPNKEIISISIITGNGGGYGHPIVFGMFIHYESTS